MTRNSSVLTFLSILANEESMFSSPFQGVMVTSQCRPSYSCVASKRKKKKATPRMKIQSLTFYAGKVVDLLRNKSQSSTSKRGRRQAKEIFHFGAAAVEAFTQPPTQKTKIETTSRGNRSNESKDIDFIFRVDPTKSQGLRRGETTATATATAAATSHS